MTARLQALVPFALLAALIGPSPEAASRNQDQIPPPPEYYDIREIRGGLGTDRSVAVSFGAACDACKQSIAFYKRLMSADGMDGKRKRLIVLSTDGVVPVDDVLRSVGFKPHALVSYPRASKLRELSDQAPDLVVLDASGKPIGTWRGRLSAAQEADVLTLLSKGG